MKVSAIRQINTGFSIAVALVIAFGYLSLKFSNMIKSSNDSRTDSGQIRLALEELDADLTDAETAQRGYLLTERPSYLEPFYSARESVQENLRKLHQSYDQEAEHANRLKELELLINRKIDELTETIELAKNGKRVEALRIVKTDLGAQLMNQIRIALHAMRLSATDRWTKKLENTNTAIDQGIQFSAAASVLGFILIGLVWFYVRRQTIERFNAESNLNRFFNNSLDLQCIAEENGKFKRVNKAFLSLLGYTEKEMFEISYLELIHPEDQSATQAYVRKLKLVESIDPFVNRIRCKDGDYKWFAWKTTYVGGIFIATARDVTKERNFQFEEQQDKQRMASIIDLQYEIAAQGRNQQQLMDTVIAKTRDLTEASGSVIEFCEGDEMVYKAASGSARDNIGLRLKRSGSLSGRCSASGQIQICEEALTDPRVDRDACLKIGLRSMVVVPLRNEQKVIGVLKVFSDKPKAFTQKHIWVLELMSGFLGVMLERATATQAQIESEQEVRRLNDQLEATVEQRTHELRESNERFQFVMENTDQIFWMTNSDQSQFYYISKNYERIFQSSCDSLLKDANSFKQWIHPEDLEHITAVPASQRVGEARTLQYRIVRPDKTVRWIRSSAFPLYGPNGTIHRVIGISSDITEFMTASQAEQAAVEASKLKSEFLANMSHEIRTPLNGVLGMAHLLLNTELSSQQQAHAHDIVRSGENLLHIINDILDLSKAEAGKVELEIIDFDLHQVIEDVESVLALAAAKKGLELKSYFDVGPLKWFSGDPSRIRQVLMNLVSNAIKFTEAGSVHIYVSAKSLTSEESCLRIEVKDTGIGIPAESKKKMFQPFSQADGSTTRKYGGTGLGLSISKHLVQLMRGEVGFTSAENQGSTFWFSLNLKPATHPALIVTNPANTHHSTQKLRAILAEDNSVNQIIASHMIEELGHSIVVVGNGQELLRAIQEAPYDLIFMDCQMPVMDGFEATRHIRTDAKLKAHAKMKIIALTANAMSGDREKCLKAGMDDYISKPIKIEELESAISRVMLKNSLTQYGAA